MMSARIGAHGNVHVPDAVVHQLEVPLALAGLQVERDQALAEQTVARPMAAVVVAGRQLDRQITMPELFVDRHLRPDAGIAGVRPRILQPGVVAEFAGRGMVWKIHSRLPVRAS